MGKNSQIKKLPKPDHSQRLKAPSNAKTFKDIAIKHPIFCFKYLHKNFHIENCKKDEKTALLDRIVKFSAMTWEDIQLAPRHGLGTEKISTKSLTANIPNSFTEDVTHLLAFRFNDKAPFVCYRNKYIIHIMFIDRDYTLYKH